MRKTYIFLILIAVILYLSYLIVNYKYKEYKINNHIEYIKNENDKISDEIIKSKDSLEYLNTNAYKNKILKEEQALKNK
jgi:cell division protein FtsL